MKIAVVIPLWKRKEITEFCFKHLLSLIEGVDEHEFEVVCVVSEDYWPSICEKYGFEWLYCPNDPLGRKINAGVLYALTLEPDYVMMMNSDSVIRKELFDHYRPFFEKREKYFGVDRVTFLDSKTNRGKDYTYEFTILGVGKMMRADVIRSHFNSGKNLYPNERNRGLDNAMMDNMIQAKIWPVMVSYPGQLVFDVKSEVNIWPWDHFENRGTEVIPELCYKIV